MNIKPLGDNIVLKLIPNDNSTASGIILTSKSQEKPQLGKVIAIGSSNDIEIAIGNTVFIPKDSGMDVKFENEEYTIIKHKDILAIIE